MTKERKLYVVILAIALAVLLWDRLQTGALSGPDTAQAGTAEETQNSTKPQVKPDLSRIESPPAKTTAAGSHGAGGDKLIRLPLSDECRIASPDVRDLFTVSEKMLHSLSRSDNESETRNRSLSQTHQSFVLSGTVVTAAYQAAMIDNELYHVGDRIGPFELVRVYPRAVLLKNDTGYYILYRNP